MGTCHFLEGNLRAKKRVEYTKKLLDETGINGDRLEFFHIAASEAPLFAETVRTMTERAKELGPNPLKKRLQKESNVKKE